MIDTIATSQRSAVMKKIRSGNTGPERALRSALHRVGLRFRLHRRDLPGTPDIVFPKQRLAIFVQGCFWHQHQGCRDGRIPKSRLEYWEKKLHANVARDERNRAQLLAMGWSVIEVWECDIRKDIDGAVLTVQCALHKNAKKSRS
jgi:DNA mismatch endonuclease (patch repair protein)